ncbi:MAG TPA: hypothetical protein VFS44_07805 [Gemmatimonadaceae bacterium]|nr:hypothetical protein [Gemmatimonadaceae bacterium]
MDTSLDGTERPDADGAAAADAAAAHPILGAHAPGWFRRRARNVYQRPLLIGSVATGVVVLMVIGLVAVPRQLERTESAMLGGGEPPDTATIGARVDAAGAQAAAADAALSRARDEVLGRATITVVDTFPPALRQRRDSLVLLSADLARLLQRASDAPLPASYRALGESPAMRGTPGIRPLLDTLAEVERSRADFGAVGGVDPIFVALTSRATQIGKRIQQLGTARSEALRREIARLTPAPPRIATPEDTLRLALTRDSAESTATATRRELAQARLVTQALAERAERARQIAAFGVPAATLLAAALVLGIALGFGVALAVEIRQPHVSDEAEAEAITGARVLVTLGARRGPPERRRRRADQEVPPLIAVMSEEYELLHAQLADRSFDIPSLAVVGDDPMVTAIVAANLGAVVARQVRTTLLVDADVHSRSLSAVTRARSPRGLSDVLAGRAEWAEVIRSVVVARERTMDVLPAGTAGGLTPKGAPDAFAKLLAHLTRRYECVIVSAPAADPAGIAPVASVVGDVLPCVRAGRTSIAALRQLTTALGAQGATIRGVVVWDRPDPVPAMGTGAASAPGRNGDTGTPGGTPA